MHYSYVMYMLNNIIINLYVCIYTNIYIYIFYLNGKSTISDI